MQDVLIKKGNHYCNNHKLFPFYYNLKSLSYEIEFTNSCLYDLKNQNNYDINKLIGLSFGYHHHNSVRFGWNCISQHGKRNRINIYSYCYKNKVREYELLTSLFPNMIYTFKISIGNNKVYLEILNQNKTIITYREIEFEKICKFQYELFPYFGGDEVAPHDITILMNKL